MECSRIGNLCFIMASEPNSGKEGRLLATCELRLLSPLEKGTSLVIDHGISYRKAAKAVGIKYGKLHYYVSKKLRSEPVMKIGRPTILSPINEEKLVTLITEKAKEHHCMTPAEVRKEVIK